MSKRGMWSRPVHMVMILIFLALFGALCLSGCDSDSPSETLYITAQSEVTLNVSDRVAIDYQVSEAASVITPKSSNTSVFTVRSDSNGVIYISGLSAGNAVLTLDAFYSEQNATAEIAVEVIDSSAAEEPADPEENLDDSEESQNADLQNENTSEDVSNDDDSSDDSTSIAQTDIDKLTENCTEANLADLLGGKVNVNGNVIEISGNSTLLINADNCEVHMIVDGTAEELSAGISGVYVLPKTPNEYQLLIKITDSQGTHYQLFTVKVSA